MATDSEHYHAGAVFARKKIILHLQHAAEQYEGIAERYLASFQNEVPEEVLVAMAYMKTHGAVIREQIKQINEMAV